MVQSLGSYPSVKKITIRGNTSSFFTNSLVKSIIHENMGITHFENRSDENKFQDAQRCEMRFEHAIIGHYAANMTAPSDNLGMFEADEVVIKFGVKAEFSYSLITIDDTEFIVLPSNLFFVKAMSNMKSTKAYITPDQNFERVLVSTASLKSMQLIYTNNCVKTLIQTLQPVLSRAETPIRMDIILALSTAS